MKLTNITLSETIKNCEVCKKVFYKKRSHSWKNWKRARFCSKVCFKKGKVGFIGKPVWNKGIKIDRNKYPNMGHQIKHKEESLIKISLGAKQEAIKRGKDFFRRNQKLAIESAKKEGFKNFHGTLGRTKELSYIWKGNNASYSSKHKWIQKYWKKTGVCENCGTRPKPYGNRKWGTEWHSKDEKYNREDRSTWLEVCKKCHNKFDRQL